MSRFWIVLFVLLYPASLIAEEHAHVHGEELQASDFSPESLFLTDSRWSSTDGKEFRLRQMRGTPMLVALFYATCNSACPAIIDAMKKVEKSLPPEHTAGLKFVLITFDPINDTADVLRHYAVKRDLKQDRWLLLRGQEDDTRELAVILGSKFKRIGPTDFAHSNLIALIDGEGRVVARAKTLSEVAEFSVEVNRFLAAK